MLLFHNFLFVLGEMNNLKRETVKEKLKAKAKMTLESLELPALRVASDYLTENEMKAKFKKPKKVYYITSVIHILLFSSYFFII